MRSVNLICFVMLVFFLPGGCGNYAADNLPGAEQVIEEIQRAGEAASTIFAEVEETITHDNKLQLNLSYTMWRTNENVRIEGSIPDLGRVVQVFENNRMSVYLEDRGVVYIYNQSDSQARRSDNVSSLNFSASEENVLQVMRGLGNLFEVSVIRFEDVNNERAIVLGLRPLNATHESQLTWWVDMDTWFPIKREFSLKNYVSSVSYANLKINEPLDESLFTLNVPSDVQIINALPGTGVLPNVGAGE